MRFLPAILGTMFALGMALAGTDIAWAPPIGAENPIEEGISNLANVVQPPTGNVNDIRDVIVRIINFLLSFLALIAVIVIIAAGFVLIFGFGSEGSAARARKVILYTVIGLIIIFFARVIVGFFTEELPAVFSN